jgi:hypothetical protein
MGLRKVEGRDDQDHQDYEEDAETSLNSMIVIGHRICLFQLFIFI